MKISSKFSITVFLLLFGIIAIYFITRLVSILSLPIFTDEAIYVRWAQIAGQDANWRFISLTDGKQPSFVWLAIAFMKFFDEPLLASRLVSVFAGFFSVLGLFFLGKELFNNKYIGLITAGLYVIYPMALVYDRLALYDSLVGAFFVWALYIEVLLVRRVRLDIALILGFVLGGGVLTKTNAFFSIYLLPFTLLLFDFKNKQKYKKLITWGLYAFIATVIAYGFYSILRLSPYFHIIGQKNSIFVHSLSEWINHPFRDVVSNLRGLIDWFIVYFSFPFIFLVVASFFVKRRDIREKLLMVVFFLAPFVALALFGKLIYPRYIFFMTLPLLPLVAYSFYWFYLRIKNKIVYFILAILFLALPLRADYFILFNFSNAPIPKLDLDQYSNEWPAGGGVREAVAFFEQESQKGKIFIATEGTFGLMPYALEIYLHKNPNVQIFGFWPVGRPPVEMVEASQTIPTYVVFYQPCPSCEIEGAAPKDWPLTLVQSIPKGKNGASLSIYKVNP